MHVPPSPQRESPYYDNQTWSDIAIAYLMLLAIPVLLWFVTNPLVGGATLLGVVTLRAAFSRVRAGLEFVHQQCCIVLRVGERIRITLRRSPMEG